MNSLRSLIHLASLVGVLVTSACATTGADVSAVPDVAAVPHRRPPPPTSPAKASPLQFVADGAYAYVDGVTGAALSLDDVKARVAAHRVVVVGEQHDQLAHHEAQRRIIELVAADGPGVAVGLEMMTWDKQSELDRLTRGELDVDAFAAAVDWKKAWGFDFGLYRGIFEIGRDVGARFVALNAPRALVRALRTQGVEGLSAEDAALVPELDLGDELHRRWFEGIFQSAGHPLKASEVDGFYRAQVLWDESMADRAVRALRDGARQVVVIAGAGHVAAGRGIPQRVERRLNERVLTIVPLSVSSSDVDTTVQGAINGAEADILVIPRFDHEIEL